MSLNPDWLNAIDKPSCYPHPVSKIQRLETHISWLFLTGDWVYKVKKPVNFGFVNFTTLELRRSACYEEIRLNRRTAPDLYDNVVSLTINTDGLRFEGTGNVVEYAVRMKQFPQEALLDRCLARGELSFDIVDQLAFQVADLHCHAEIAPSESSFGEPDLVREAVDDCLDVLDQRLSSEVSRNRWDLVKAWFQSEWNRLCETFADRKRQNWIRECHGDLHLGNLVLFRGKPTLFDCLEFNPQLRWIDVMSDVAFLVMDLHDHRAGPLAFRLLNQWLEVMGDFEGLDVLKYYLVYRAVVRAKVAALQLGQSGIPESEASRQRELLESYIDLAVAQIQPARPSIVLMHGVSCSGKSYVSSQLAMALESIRIRSDVERKRLFGMWPAQPANAHSEFDLYSADATRQTYQRMLTLVRTIVGAGYSVIVDATFLKNSDRAAFAALASELGVSSITVACQAPEVVLHERISRRKALSGDASDADASVLRGQLSSLEPLDPAELRSAIVLDTTSDRLEFDIQSLRDRLRN